MVNSLSQMIKNLSVLKLYNLSPDSLIYKELLAYDAGFKYIENLLDISYKDIFVQTCSIERLTKWERLLNLPSPKSVAIQARRDIVLYKLAVAPNDFYLEGMQNSIKSTGVDATITENPPLGTLDITFNYIFGEYSNLDSVRAQIRAMLPAHLDAEFNIGVMTWEDFEKYNLTFFEFDAKNFTWEWFDINGIPTNNLNLSVEE